jgi:hypothetical protein
MAIGESFSSVHLSILKDSGGERGRGKGERGFLDGTELSLGESKRFFVEPPKCLSLRVLETS